MRLRRKVALKVLPPELAFREEVRRRFLREAQMAAQLCHPNIVPIYAVDERDGTRLLRRWGSWRASRSPQLLAASSRGRPSRWCGACCAKWPTRSHYAHAHGVVHRDVKPDNILIERRRDRALVTDFGIARAAEGDARLTATGIAVGTPAYMSPEQAMGERDVDGRADIYALGIVGYQMLAGELPFQAANTPSMLMKHLSEPPRPLLDLRPDLPRTHLGHRARARQGTRRPLARCGGVPRCAGRERRCRRHAARLAGEGGRPLRRRPDEASRHR